ncbi:MAG: urea ABC transporter ATP-binding subunit UrtE [SAR202 cluster bacterium]|nr:urea ABC transporter ATP-binding subunit UrtE [SAR202 cluster bacterium]
MLTLEKLSAAYGTSRVLWDVDLAVGTGEAVALLGRNGAGKTTLLRTIVGLHPASSGRVLLDGKDVTRVAPHERTRMGMAYVPQGRGIFPHLTVEQNLRMGAAGVLGAGGKVKPLPNEAVFALFPALPKLMDRKGGNLSGGEQQQLAIARALIAQPKLLLLDEPTEGLQPSIVMDIEHALTRIRREMKVTVLLVEQHLAFAWEFADRYYVVQKGRHLDDGSTRERDHIAVGQLLNL